MLVRMGLSPPHPPPSHPPRHRYLNPPRQSGFPPAAAPAAPVASSLNCRFERRRPFPGIPHSRVSATSPRIP